jgi:antitoxin HicB
MGMEKEIMLSISLTKEHEGGYSVVCTGLDVASQGETVDEAVSNIKEAVELYIESAEELGIKDEVLEKLGIGESGDEGKEIATPIIYRTEIPIKLTLQ